MFKFMKAMFFSTHREKFHYWLDGMLNRSSEFRRFETNVPPSIIRASYNYAYQNYRPGNTPEETMLQMEKAVVDVVHFCMNYVQAHTDALRGNLNKEEREVFTHFVNEDACSIEFEKRRDEMIAEWSKDPNWIRRNPEVARRFLGKDKHWREAFGLPLGGNPCDPTIHDNVRDEMIAKWLKDPNWVRRNPGVKCGSDKPTGEDIRTKMISEWSKDPNWVRRNPGVK